MTGPTAQHIADFNDKGYFLVRGLLLEAEIDSIRSALMRRVAEMADNREYTGDHLLEPSARQDPDAVPIAERFRKIRSTRDMQEPWEFIYANPRVLAYVKHWLGDDILNKFASCFLKPAKVGGPTPWHQDIGLWRDTNEGAINAWLAIDPATRANGCLQVVPGSHKGPVVEHVSYEGGVHAEIPHELCQDLDVEHIEMQPGDAIFWHSNLWHYSPPNQSDQNRIGCGAVWMNPAQIPEVSSQQLAWSMRHGEPVAFPPPVLLPMVESQTPTEPVASEY